MVRLHALDRKLLRDLWALRAQSFAIAMVLACGVAIFLTGLGMMRALEATKDDYYSRQRFAEVFSSVQRAPMSMMEEITALPGVRRAEARVSGYVILDLPGREAPASGQVLSLPPGGPALNVPLLVSGQFPDPDSTLDVAVTARFAQANGFTLGSSFSATVDGTRLRLRIVGTVRSPEYIYALPPGGLMPDDEGFAVIWMAENAAAATFGLTGAFNAVALTLQRGANPQAVIDALDRLLKPWGSTGAHARKDQMSNAFIEAELEQLRNMSVMLPPIFFGIAGFLVNMVLGRIVALDRSEIGLLKALGYRKTEIALHYLLMAGVIALLGIAMGWVAGA